jgi:type I restriction enzyme, S subunit
MELKPGYKQTEVGVIPEEWEVPRLDSLGAGAVPPIKAGPFGSSLTKDQYVSEGYKVYGQEQVIRGDHLFGDYFISTEKYRELESCAVRPGDVLLSLVGTTGKLLEVPDDALPGVINPRLVRFSFDRNKVLSKFFRYQFESDIVQSQLNRQAQGGTMGVLNAGTLRPFRIPLPPLPEQRAIATALSDMDALLAGLGRLIAKKRDLKQATMQALLNGRVRLPGFNGRWEVKRLGEIAKIQRGASPRPIDSPVWFDENSSIGWVRISDVTRSGMFLVETTQRLSHLGVQHSRPVATGSLIMSICATVGRPIITQIDVCIHDGFVVFDNLKADQLFIYYTLKSIEPDWTKHGQTGSQMNLNTGLITGTPINLPPLKEQSAIAIVLADMDAEIAALEQRRRKTQDLKQAMMQELLTGRIRLVDNGEWRMENGEWGIEKGE